MFVPRVLHHITVVWMSNYNKMTQTHGIFTCDFWSIFGGTSRWSSWAGNMAETFKNNCIMASMGGKPGRFIVPEAQKNWHLRRIGLMPSIYWYVHAFIFEISSIYIYYPYPYIHVSIYLCVLVCKCRNTVCSGIYQCEANLLLKSPSLKLQTLWLCNTQSHTVINHNRFLKSIVLFATVYLAFRYLQHAR